jgi:PAS domain S-box-containing protein
MLPGKTKILIVEDESIVARDIEACLAGFGYEVAAVTGSGEEAVRLAGERKPDIVLMDIILKSRVDGIEAARRIRFDFKIPVIYLTSHADRATVERAKVAEPYGYVLKPFDDRELYAAIETALYRHRRDDKWERSRAWFAAHVEALDDAVIVIDKEFRIAFHNTRADALTGWEAEAAVAQPAKNALAVKIPATGENIESLAAKCFREKASFALDDSVSLAGKNGREIPIAGSLSPINDTEGRVTGAILVFRERRPSENVCGNGASRNFHARDNITEAVVTINAKGIIETFNPGAERVFGCSRAEAVGLHVSRLLEALPFQGRRNDGSSFPLEPQVIKLRLRERSSFIGLAHNLAVGGAGE